MLKLILNPHVSVILLVILALGTPAGAFVYARFFCLPRRRKRILRRPLIWILGIIGPLILGLWFLFNAIAGWLGLDSFLALLINLCIFSAVGAALGAILRFLPRRRSGTPPPRT